MKDFKVLFLTDHKNHTVENSLYELAAGMYRHPMCKQVDIASRHNKSNQDFFKGDPNGALWVTTIDEALKYSADPNPLTLGLHPEDYAAYDLIWLRMPPPIDHQFLQFIADTFKDQIVINNPKGIMKTGSKEFLMNFQEVCPPMKLCYTIDDILEFKNQFPIVLKPFRDYGGKGIIRIDGDTVWKDKNEMLFSDFTKMLPEHVQYLAVKFLKNVYEGDKRIIVVNGQIMGASLRLPPKDSWICNVAMGGSDRLSDVTQEELEIVRLIDPVLHKMGIVMYGIDTLVEDDGKRVLSEINTTSIGGLPQIGRAKGLPVVDDAIDLIWEYFEENQAMYSQ